jgi:hypothetical protein
MARPAYPVGLDLHAGHVRGAHAARPQFQRGVDRGERVATAGVALHARLGDAKRVTETVNPHIRDPGGGRAEPSRALQDVRNSRESLIGGEGGERARLGRVPGMQRLAHGCGSDRLLQYRMIGSPG